MRDAFDSYSPGPVFFLLLGAQSASAAEAWRIVAATGTVKSGAPGVMPVAVNSKADAACRFVGRDGCDGTHRGRARRGNDRDRSEQPRHAARPARQRQHAGSADGRHRALSVIGKQKAPHFQSTRPIWRRSLRGRRSRSVSRKAWRRSTWSKVCRGRDAGPRAQRLCAAGVHRFRAARSARQGRRRSDHGRFDSGRVAQGRRRQSRQREHRTAKDAW